MGVVSFFKRTLGYVSDQGKLETTVQAASGSNSGSSSNRDSIASSSDGDEEHQTQTDDAQSEDQSDDRSAEGSFSSRYGSGLGSPRRRRQAPADSSGYAAASLSAALGGAVPVCRGAMTASNGGHQIYSRNGGNGNEGGNNNAPQSAPPRSRAFATSSTDWSASSAERCADHSCWSTERFTDPCPAFAEPLAGAPPRREFIDRGEGGRTAESEYGETVWVNNSLAMTEFIRQRRPFRRSDGFCGETPVTERTFGGSVSSGRDGGVKYTGAAVKNFGELLVAARPNGGGSARRDVSLVKASLWDAAASRNAWRVGGQGAVASCSSSGSSGKVLDVDDDGGLVRESERYGDGHGVNASCTGVIEVGEFESDVDLDLSTGNLDSGRCLRWEAGASLRG